MPSTLESGIRLNLELFYEVVDYVNNGSHSDWARQATLSNIMLSCQALYDFTIPLLYRRIYLRTRRAAHGCFTTLLANSQLASLVREIYIQGKRDPGNEGGYDAIPLLPLFARALLRTPNLQCLMFDSLVYGKYGPYNHQLLSEKPYKFQLQTLGMSSLYLAETDWHDIIPFLTHQSQLQRLHLDFPPPERYAEHLNFPHLKSVAFESSISREEDIAAFFSHLTYVTDVTVRFTDYAPRPRLLFTATRLTRYAPNLTSLTMKLRTMEQFDMFPNEIPLSKTLHFLTILMTDGDMHPYRILLGIESLPLRWMVNLKSVLIEYNISPMINVDEWVRRGLWPEEMGAIAFYFGRGDGDVYLVKQDANEIEWIAEKVEWKDVPSIHTHAVEQTQFDSERL